MDWIYAAYQSYSIYLCMLELLVYLYTRGTGGSVCEQGETCNIQLRIAHNDSATG